jgi:hypothetical protein
MKLFIITLIIILSFSSSFASSELKPRVHCPNEQARESLITKLNERYISYQIEKLGPDQREYIVWKRSDDDIVRNIIKTDLHCSCGDPEKDSTTMASDRQTKYLANLLKENGIEFKIIDNPFVGGPENAIEYNVVDKEIIMPLMIRTLKEVPYSE